MQNISVQELKQRLDAGEHPHIIDVREPDEYAEFNIGAKLMPLGQIMATQTDDIDDWKEDEIIIHCKAGARSMQAGMMLEMMGFTNIKNLTGGMVAWKEAVSQ